jgi:hypothetical protein
MWWRRRAIKFMRDVAVVDALWTFLRDIQAPVAPVQNATAGNVFLVSGELAVFSVRPAVTPTHFICQRERIIFNAPLALPAFATKQSSVG